MKGIVISTDNKLSIREFEEPMYKSIGAVVGGYIEVVHPDGLEQPLVMIVNEEGLLLDLPLNKLGCHLYRTHEHCQPIVGDIVIMQIVNTDDGPDIGGLEDNLSINIADQIMACADYITEED